MRLNRLFTCKADADSFEGTYKGGRILEDDFVAAELVLPLLLSLEEVSDPDDVDDDDDDDVDGVFFRIPESDEDSVLDEDADRG